MLLIRLALVLALTAVSGFSFAAGGPLGIDHRWNYDNTGIWKRQNQNLLQILGAVGTASIALSEGGESRLGHTAWQSVDSTALAALVGNGLKPVFSRERPSQTDNPNHWFSGGNHSFPSGEVSTITGVVTPYILEYRHDHPAVYALSVLPAYDAIARMKVRGHWQTDVLVGAAIGFGSGYVAHDRQSPYILGVLPGGFAAGFKKDF